MLRFRQVGKGVNAIGVDAQGLPVCRSCLLRVAHSYAPSIDTERSKNKPHQQHISNHLKPPLQLISGAFLQAA